MAIYIPETILLRISQNTIHAQNLTQARQFFWPSKIQFQWDGTRSLFKTKSSLLWVSLIQTLFKKMIRELQYPTLVAIRLEGLGSRFELIDSHRILFKIGRSHSYYLRLPLQWEVRYLSPRICWFTGPNSTEVSLLVDLIKRYKRMTKYRSQGFISSQISLPRLPKK